jgi:F-box-like
MALSRPVIWDGVLNPQATGRNGTVFSILRALNDHLPMCSRRESPVAIGALPDEILLKIFDFCRLDAFEPSFVTHKSRRPWSRMWPKLVHVCQRWRHVVFSSPLSLDLHLDCTNNTSVREMLDVWPPFPIEIHSSYLWDNTMAALGHSDRICEITLYVADEDCERLATVMQKPFPVLTALHLTMYFKSYEHVLVLSDTFLGGSAPSLRSLYLKDLKFPTLPQFLLSCNNLSELHLVYLSDIGYNSSEAMATGLSALTRLTRLHIELEQSGAIGRPPPPTRALLPALTHFDFRGANEYLEDLLIRIDTPQLEGLAAVFKEHVFDIRQVVSHSRTLGPFDCAVVIFRPYSVWIDLSQSEGTHPRKWLNLDIMEDAPGRQVSSTAQICTQSLSLLSGITELKIGSETAFLDLRHSDLEDLMVNPEWLVLFRQFTAVQTLHLFAFGQVQPYILSSLGVGEHTGQSVTEVLLPELQHLYLYRSYWPMKLEEETIEPFVVVRQQSDHPVMVHHLPNYYDWAK